MKYIGVMIGLFFSMVCYGEIPSQLLEQKLQAIHAFSAHFSQTVSENTQVLQTSKGRIALKRPKLFRFETTYPMEQLVVADGSQLWLFDKDLEQVTVTSQKEGLAQTPALFLTAHQPNIGQFYQVTCKKSASSEVFNLVAKKQEEPFKQIQFIFKSAKLIGIQLEDKLGQVTKLRFTQIKMNPVLNLAEFQFMPPKGVDVIKK